MLKALHAIGTGLDAVDENGWTCLMWCANSRKLFPWQIHPRFSLMFFSFFLAGVRG